MAYNEKLAQRVREVLSGGLEWAEIKMFGGLCFMHNGHMCVGVSTEDLMVRVGPEQYEAALAQPHAREMDFTGRPLKGFIYVEEDGVNSADALAAWIGMGMQFTGALPPKKKKPRKPKPGKPHPEKNLKP